MPAIFIVDDDPVVTLTLKELLKEVTATVHCFESAEACFENLNLNPRLIIMDYNLSSTDKTKKNGLDVVQEIKLHNPNIEIFALSSQENDYKLVHKFIQAGASEYFMKDPEGMSSLKIAVLECIED